MEIQGCKTDNEVLKVVKSIREDILPIFKDYVVMNNNKILIRKIHVSPKEVTKGGLIIAGTDEKTTQTQGEAYFMTNPNQAVVIAVGDIYSPEGYKLEPVMKPGDHILTNEVNDNDLRYRGMMVRGHVVANIHINDVVCVLKDDIEGGPANSISDTETIREGSELPIKENGNKPSINNKQL